MDRGLMLILWLLLVLFISIVPVPRTGIETGEFDKLVHFVIYGITGIFILRSLADKGSRPLIITLLSIIASSTYGFFLEVVQSLLPYRSFSVNDILANCSGATIFVISWGFLKKGLLKGKG